jgi:hypothetical protein
MIRKPPAGWQQLNEDTAVQTVRTAVGIARGGARMARRGGHVAQGLACYFFAALWGAAGMASGLATGSLPSIIGIGAMVAFMLWLGRRAFAKARETSG